MKSFGQDRLMMEPKENKADFAVCRLNSYNNLMRKAMIKMKKQNNLIQKGNMGFAFIFFEKQE